MSKMVKILGLALLMVAGFASSAHATTSEDDDEAYPPRIVIIELDPLACDATKITGEVEFLLPGSEITVTLDAAASGWKALAPLATTTATANEDGEAFFTLTVPAGTYGTFTVTASGLDTNGDEVTVSGTVTLVKCQPLPETGSSSTGNFLNIGAVALMGGLMLVVATMRRRRSVAA